jgi:hypothetical protein
MEEMEDAEEKEEAEEMEESELSVLLDVYNTDSDDSFLREVDMMGVLSAAELDVLMSEDWDESYLELEHILDNI